MKLIILVAVAVAAVAVAAPTEPSKILKSNFEQSPEGNFGYEFETENGISHAATGELKNVVDEDNKPRTILVIRGGYAYTNTDGVREEITYVADESGFHPEGNSIPKVPVARR